jgi:hypothetical protein
MPRFFFPTFFLFVMQLPIVAAPIGQFPETTDPEAAPCYFKTADGRGLDLSSICGKSAASRRDIDPSQQNLAPTAVLNPGFRAAVNANPGSPFGRNPSLTQCYIVDTDGNPCQP